MGCFQNEIKLKIKKFDKHSICRWTYGLKKLSKITFTSEKPSGYLLPKSFYALPNDELFSIPGFNRDINKSREEAKKIFKDYGYEGLEFIYSNRAVSHPYGP